MREVSSNSFIYEIKNALTNDQCDDMVARFEANPKQQVVGFIGDGEVDRQWKQSTDLYIGGWDDWKDIDNIVFNSLTSAVKLLIEQNPVFKDMPLEDVGYQIQRTKQGEFYNWHIDSNAKTPIRRQIAAIWYLNDVESGGTTDFDAQGVSITPEKGKLVLFPPFWTHRHRGAVVDKGVKYIVVTWLRYSPVD